MPAYWKFWFVVLDLGFDAQRVIALRLAKIAAGGAAADIECGRMVSEKFATAAVQAAVRANRRRLVRAKRFDGVTLPLRRMASRLGKWIGRLLKR